LLDQESTERGTYGEVFYVWRTHIVVFERHPDLFELRYGTGIEGEAVRRTACAEIRVGYKGFKMVSRRRLKIPTLGIVAATGVAECVPVGAIVVIPVALLNHAQLIDCVWEGKAMRMFARDLRDRGEEVKTRAVAAS
jgi:hypothetical protein